MRSAALCEHGARARYNLIRMCHEIKKTLFYKKKLAGSTRCFLVRALSEVEAEVHATL